MASNQHEGKGVGALFRESFQKGVDEANTRRKRKAEAKRIAAERTLAQTEHQLREILAGIAAGCGVADRREELAGEIEVWRELYDDWTRA